MAHKRTWPNSRPRDAASLIVIKPGDTAGGRVLVGRRRPGHVFMPGVYVFPGGKVEAADSRAPYLCDLRPAVLRRAATRMKRVKTISRARAFALAAVRETYEEAGLLIGKRVAVVPRSRNRGWQDFLSHGVVPSLGQMVLLARAITPPRQPRRYDTRFFIVSYDAVAARLDERTGFSDELTDLHWLRLDATHSLPMAHITSMILKELRARLQRYGLKGSAPVPFYAWERGHFRRRLL